MVDVKQSGEKEGSGVSRACIFAVLPKVHYRYESCGGKNGLRTADIRAITCKRCLTKMLSVLEKNIQEVHQELDLYIQEYELLSLVFKDGEKRKWQEIERYYHKGGVE